MGDGPDGATGSSGGSPTSAAASRSTVRFELSTQRPSTTLVAYGTRTPGWERVVDGYDVVVVDDREHLRGLTARGLEPSFRDAAIVVLERPRLTGTTARAAGTRGRR